MSSLSLEEFTDDLTVRIRDFRRTLRRTAEMLRGSTIPVEDYDPREHGSLISFTGVSGYREVDRYWVNAPFAFVSINYDPEANEHLYYVVEPELDDLETELLEKLFSDIRQSLIYRRDMDDGPAEGVLKDELHELLEVYGVEVDMTTYYRLFYYLYRSFRGFGKLDPLMADPNIEDISCDGYDLPIFVYHEEYTDVETNIVVFRVTSMPAAELVTKLQAAGVLLLTMGPDTVRAVTNLMVGAAGIDAAIAAFRAALK